MLLDQLSLLAGGGGLLLGAFLLVGLVGRLRPLTAPDRLLGLLIGVCALNAGHPALSKVFGFHLRAPGQFFEPPEFLLPPLLAAYGMAAVQGAFVFRRTHLLHFVPFLVAVGTSVWFTFYRQVPATVSTVMWAILSLQMVAYLGPALRMFHRHEATLVDRVSNLAPVDLGWLRRFFWVATGLCVVSLTVLALLLHALPPMMLGTGTSFALTAAVWFLGARGLDQQVPEPADTATSPAPEEAVLAELPPSPAGIAVPAKLPPLAPAEIQKLRAKLEQVLVEQRPHLNPNLSLGDLAQLVGVQRNQLSFVINTELRVNFYDLVNGWRVKEFRSLAADRARDGEKILALAFDAGFNSKPTFNKVVLKLTGKTPTQVRQDEIAARPTR